MTFHNGKQIKLRDVIKNTKPKSVQPTRNHLLELRHIKIELEIPIWDPMENKAFWYHEIVVISPHTKKNEIDQFQKWIDELCQFQRKEPFNEIWIV